MLAGIFGAIPARASASDSSTPERWDRKIDNKHKDAAYPNKSDCVPDSGWMWTDGPLKPDVALQVQQKLMQVGIDAIVAARSYGETDICGIYHHHGIDFTVTLSDTASTRRLSQQALVDLLLPILVELGKPSLGNVRLFSPQGEVIPVNTHKEPPAVQTLDATPLSADVSTKQVYVIVYDPLLSNGQKLSEYLHWNDHAVITQQTIDFFTQSSNYKVNYTVVDTALVTSGWPELIDGFSYTEAEYLAVWADPQQHHNPTEVNYDKIVNSPELDICGKLNRGEIDEVWVYNGPWFGFYESRLVGPGAYYLNSSPVSGAHNCNKILPIMGPSVERTVQEAVHNFTHRTEDTMKKVYGSWQQNDTSHSWDKFALVKAQSPSYSYSGCGSSHYPPNGITDYDYSNSSTVQSNCDDFANYPNLSDPLEVSQPVTCSVWGCGELDYFRYWFGHFPSNPDCGPDDVANDWWKYIANPGIALYPSNACQPDMHLISGNAGTGDAILSYMDGTLKTVAADSYGNYFLMVSNHWSGTITPSKYGSYTFSPANNNYTDVQGDLYGQDYTAQGTDATSYYVDVATGDDSNSCTSIATPCRNIQETVNKARAGDVIYAAGGTYLFSTNATPNVVIINKNITLSGGWNPDFTSQDGASTIDGANVNNGILAISGTVVVENFIIKNSTSSNSGAIYIVNGNFTLNKSTLRNNVATSNGAGIFLDNGALNIINSTISGNAANSSGGGIYASNNSGASVTIQNSTIANNRASTGGGISQTNGTYNITNTIIANNSSSASSPDCDGAIAIANFNIIENTAGCSITSGSNNLSGDPQIDIDLTGDMSVHMPLAGSPVIDAGTAVGCPSTDQQATARPQGSGCDIGSIEYIAETIAPTVLTITRDNDNPTDAANVDFAVTFSESVTGVDAGDFALTTTGVSGASISGVSGAGNVYTVTVNTGGDTGTIRLDVVDDDSIMDASFNPLGGTGLANGNFTSGEVYTVISIITLNLNSIADNDGWVLESSETSNTGGTLNAKTNTFNLGDDKANRQYLGVLHFDTSSLPDTAVITSVTLKIQKQGLAGTDPFTTHGSLLVDIQKPYFGATAGLVIGDFQAAPGQSAVSTFGAKPVGNWYSAIMNSTGYPYVNLTGTTQFRLGFMLDDNNDLDADYMKLYSGDAAAANRPQLIIQYYIP